MEIPTVTTPADRSLLSITQPGTTRPSHAHQLPTLEIGQQLVVRVVQQLPGNHFIIDLQGTLVDASGPAALKGRSVLPVVVEQLEPQVVLRVLSERQGFERLAAEMLRGNLMLRLTAGESIEILRHALTNLNASSEPNSVPRTVATLHSAIQNLVPSDSAPTQEQIVTLLRDGGINYEAEVARLATENPQFLQQLPENDLKGMLMQAQRDVLATTNQSVIGRLIEPFASHLTNIESQQLLNFLAQLHGNPYELQIPFYVGQSASTAYLSIEPDEHWRESDEDQSSAYNFLLMLDLEGLGQTRIDGHITSKTVRVIFYLDDTDSVKAVDSMLPELEESLQAIGFEKALLAARPLKSLPSEKLQKFNSMAAGIPESVNLINERG